MPDQLTAVYLDAILQWRALRSAETPDTPALSAPLVIDAPPEYEAAQVRLMIVGQETLGWGESIAPTRDSEDILETLRDWYRDFDRGARYRATPFWQAAHQLFTTLNPSATARAFIWSNLYKMDVGGRRPPVDREAEINDAHILQTEVMALRPEVVVFFTGPQYDRRLIDCFPNATFTQISRTLARVAHPTLPLLSFRTYHPKYLRLSRQWATLATITAACTAAEL